MRFHKLPWLFGKVINLGEGIDAHKVEWGQGPAAEVHALCRRRSWSATI